jgi:hypothetical protein
VHDIGAIIWIIIVAIAVISSMRRNVQRARAAQAARTRQTQPVQQQQPPPPPVAVQAVQRSPSRSAMAGFAMPPLDAPAVAPPPRMPPPVAARVGTSPIRGMFGGGATLVRAIVAAEVLGPPKALQENTIWSPRHSEPSI